MMMAAHQHSVVEIGLPTRRPRPHMMRLAPGRGNRATVRPTFPITNGERLSLTRTEKARRVPEVERHRPGAEHRRHEVGRARQPSGLPGGDPRPVGQRRGAQTLDQRLQVSIVITTVVASPPCSGSRDGSMDSSSEQNASPSRRSYGARRPSAAGFSSSDSTRVGERLQQRRQSQRDRLRHPRLDQRRPVTEALHLQASYAAAPPAPHPASDAPRSDRPTAAPPPRGSAPPAAARPADRSPPPAPPGRPQRGPAPRRHSSARRLHQPARGPHLVQRRDDHVALVDAHRAPRPAPVPPAASAAHTPPRAAAPAEPRHPTPANAAPPTTPTSRNPSASATSSAHAITRASSACTRDDARATSSSACRLSVNDRNVGSSFASSSSSDTQALQHRR